MGAIVLVAAGILASAYQDRVFAAQQTRELIVQGDILAASVTAAIVFGDVPTVQEHVNALARNPEIAVAGVYDVRGRLVAAWARAEQKPLPGLMPRAGEDAARSVVHVPIVHEGERLGGVLIRPMREPLTRRLARHLPTMLLAVMAALLVAFLGTSQRTLREANLQLVSRALALSEANRRLQSEMERRSRAEEALRQSQKMEAVGQLAGGVAHDFNNLLTIIQGNLHLLRIADPADREAVEAYVGAADMAAGRAGHLVQRLLAFSRRQPLSPRPIDLNEIASGMKELIRHSVGDAVRVEWELRATWMTRCDRNQMENVILNLAINARDAMRGGGTLTIETSDCPATPDGSHEDLEPAEWVRLRVRDTGAGMTDTVRRKAVEPFFTTKPPGQGTGLGLSTAFAFVRQSNGQMEIETAPGAGTTVVILLPRVNAAEEPDDDGPV